MAAESSGTVLVVEDDRHIAELVELYLRRAGFRVLVAGDGHEAVRQTADQHPCLVLLDLGLPGDLDGLSVCRELVARGTPVIVVTARDDEVDRVVGLELGADDYVTKPFSPRELVARVRAVLRRAARTGAPASRVLRAGPVEIDMGRHEVRRDGQPIALTTREFDLLADLAAHRGLVRSRRQLLDSAWEPGWVGDERTVDVHVRQLRRKLGDDLPLTTVRGVGYRMD